MREPREQLQGLRELAELIGKHEVNFVIVSPPGDVAHLKAAHTPNASQIVCVSGSYDVWVNHGQRLQSTGLSTEDAADVVIGEYFIAKVARIKALKPHLDANDIMNLLRKGYQRRGLGQVS